MLVRANTLGGGTAGTDLEFDKEINIGTVKIGGTTYQRYIKIVSCGALPNNSQKNVDHNISFVGVLGLHGVATTDGTAYIPLPYVHTNTAYCVAIYTATTQLRITTASNMSSYANSYICVEYYR